MVLPCTSWLNQNPSKCSLENGSQSFSSEESKLCFSLAVGLDAEARKEHGQRDNSAQGQRGFGSLLLLHMCVFLRSRVSPLVVASDASEKGMGLVRSSSITSEGQRARSEFQSAALPIDDRFGLIELAPNAGAVRQALVNLPVRFVVYVAARLSGVRQASIEKRLARCLLASGRSGN